MKQEVHATALRTAFFLISMETDIQLREKEQIGGWALTASKGYSGDNYLN